MDREPGVLSPGKVWVPPVHPGVDLGLAAKLSRRPVSES